MARHSSEIQAGDYDSVIREQWRNDLQLATMMALYEVFPMGLFGFEMAEKAAKRNGTLELFNQKVDELKQKISAQLLIEDPILARAHERSLHVSH